MSTTEKKNENKSQNSDKMQNLLACYKCVGVSNNPEGKKKFYLDKNECTEENKKDKVSINNSQECMKTIYSTREDYELDYARYMNSSKSEIWKDDKLKLYIGVL